MKTLYQLFDEAAEFARVRNSYISIQRKSGDRSVCFIICNTINQEEDPTEIIAFGICYYKKNDGSLESFEFDLPPLKCKAFSHLDIDFEDTDWEILKEDLWRVEDKIKVIQEKLEAHL